MKTFKEMLQEKAVDQSEGNIKTIKSMFKLMGFKPTDENVEKFISQYGTIMAGIKSLKLN